MFEPHEEKKEAHVLTEGERASMPKSEFAHPQHAKTKKQKEEPGGYPVPDKQHARSALGFAAMHHGKDSAIYRQVKAKVEAKFGKKSNAFVTSQPLAPAAMHNPFAGATAAPPAMSHPGPGLGSDPFHVLGGMAAQHGIGAHEFTNNMAAGDPFGVHGVPVGGKNPFAAPSPAAARWLSTVNPFAPAPPQAANSGWGKHIADHGWKYGLGAAAAGALLYHLANRKKEQPQYV
jgi:hypothetical protein